MGSGGDGSGGGQLNSAHVSQSSTGKKKHCMVISLHTTKTEPQMFS